MLGIDFPIQADIGERDGAMRRRLAPGERPGEHQPGPQAVSAAVEGHVFKAGDRLKPTSAALFPHSCKNVWRAP